MSAPFAPAPRRSYTSGGTPTGPVVQSPAPTAARPAPADRGPAPVPDAPADPAVVVPADGVVVPPDPAAVLAHLPQAVAVVDAGRTLLWENGRLSELLLAEPGELVGRNLYAAFGSDNPAADLLRADGCPVEGVLADDPRPCAPDGVAENVLSAGGRFFALTARPLPDGEGGSPPRAVVAVRDVTAEITHRQKLDAIRQAGVELGDLSPEEVPEMTAADRVELLRGKVLQFTRDLMNFDTVEIRLLDEQTGQLRPLLSSGMGEGVAELPLVADTESNGATGLVAATGLPHLCRNTETDPHYLPGAPGAKSALTVPLILGEQVLGTFNVESREPAAFTEDDVRFAELFAREVAAALHTLELLVAEKYSTARESTERTLREVAGPLDEVLQDAAWLLERYIGHGREMSDRLKRITARGREIKTLIHRVGEELRPEPTRTPLPTGPSRPALKGARVLVADADPHVRSAAHALLGRMGCEVETVHDAAEALLMARSFPYDAALVDVRLPPGEAPGQAARAAAAQAAAGESAGPRAAPADDEPPDDAHAREPGGGGYECFRALREHAPGLPVIFMTGFGYDPAHSIVNARREGLHGVLYKPFRPEQLLGEVESAATPGE